MANPYKGEVSFTVGDNDHVVRFTTDVIASIQAEFGLSFGEIVRRMSDLDFLVLRSVVRATLRLKSMSAASALIDEVGYHKVFNHIVDAYKLAFPPPEDGENPQEGSGTTSAS